MVKPEIQKNTAQKFAFFPSNDYHYDLIDKVENTKKGGRIVLATMAFHPNEPLVQRLLNASYAAARRGVTVRLMLDAFPFIVKEGVIPGPLFAARDLPRNMTKTFKARLESLSRLHEHGGEYHIINRPRRRFSPPFAGRSHIKFAVVNDTIYIGGCNLAGTNQTDIMVRWSDARLATWLSSLEESISENGRVCDALDRKDLVKEIDKNTSLMVDAGISNQSLIFDKALALIDSAQKYVYITCQFFPNDITIRRLAAASARGVNVTVIYNHPSKHSFPLNLLHHGVVWSEKLRYPGHFFTNQLSKQHAFIHAKLLITDKGSIIGSHNYVRAGVAFGTAEIALFSTSKHFANELIRQLPEVQRIASRHKQ